MAETEIIETTALARLEPQDLLRQAIEKGSDIATIERFVALAERVHAIQAKDAYLNAMAQFHENCPPVYKKKQADTGRYKYKYAPLDEICNVIDPELGKVGLSKRWTMPTITATTVSIECIVSHRLGHQEGSGQLQMPIPAAGQRSDGSESGANALQRVGIALTYAKRYSLLAVTGVAPEEDMDGHAGDDERSEGEGTTRTEPGQQQQPAGGVRLITDAQSKMLWHIARKQLWSQEDVTELLKKHNLVAVKDIPMGRLDEILNVIKKEMKSAPASSQQQPASEQGNLA